MNNESGIFKIFCVIPAYNEEKIIVRVVNGVKLFVNEVVVVDDGSEDNTLAELKKNFHQVANIAILRHIINRGQGAALRTGTEYALKKGADIIVHFDADGQFIAEEIADLVEPIKTGKADIVFGSRFLKKKPQMPFFKKYVIMPLARFANKIFLGVNLTDPQNGFRAMANKAAGRINIHQRGMAHCSEIMRQAATGGFKIQEVPVTVIYRDFGQKFLGGIKILKELFLGALIK
jgi:glycosyltransferase involved in cell wall biosynthesis